MSGEAARAEKLVLVADRGRSLVPAGQHVLEREAVEVIPTPSLAAVVETIRQRKPRLLIVGPDLPDGSVAELCRRIRTDDALRHLSILLIASPVEHDRAEEIRRAGANDVAYRPLAPDEFDHKVGALLSVPIRKELRVLVQLRLEGTRDGFFFVARTRNLSVSGALVETDHALDPGTRIAFRFFLPGRGHEVAGQAEVIRRIGGSFGQQLHGIRFLDTASEDRMAIAEFVSRRTAAEIVRSQARVESPKAGREQSG
jgi:DNA-binding response OmpR family regulator